MGASLPKQYLEIGGRPLLHHALRTLCRDPRIEHVFVVLAAQDEHHASCDWREFAGRATTLHCGGTTRAASVFNGLMAVRGAVDAEDWVLVHDAARPCLGAAELDRLFAGLAQEDAGGLLAVPVADTLKRAGPDTRAEGTAPRADLWAAQTPQMFRYRLLVEALRRAAPEAMTDEASAIEALGLRPRLIMGDPRNLKVTYPEDLALARLILQAREAADEWR